MAVFAGGVLDREAELRRVELALELCAAGRGTALLVRGLPGMGKTSLLEASARLAERAGCAVARARGDELERQLGFAVVHQLLADPSMRQAARSTAAEGAGRAAAALVDAAAGAAAPDELSVLHGLWSMVDEAAAERPVLLLVDDIQWADEPSLRFLSFLAKRISGLPAVLLMASRPDAAGEAASSLDEVADVLDLAPLAAGSVSALVAEAFGEPPQPAFAAACEAISGGNPFYIGELLRAARAEGLRPVESSIGALANLGPDRVAKSVLRRCSDAGADAVALAEAVAILGPEVDLRHAAAVADLPADRAVRAWDDLIAAHVLRASEQLAFLHPVLRASVLEAMSRERHLTLHTRAADAFAAGGAELERVALHLLTIPPRMRSGDAAVLRHVAGTEAARGSPGSAIRLLRRALAEPLPDGERAAVELELARHEVNVGDEAAWTRLPRLAESPQLSPDERAAAAAKLIVYATEHRPPVDVAKVHRLLDSVQGLDPDTRLMHDAMSLVYRLYGFLPLLPEDLERAAGLVALGSDGSTPGRRAATVVRMLLATLDAPAAEISRLGEQALAGGKLIDDQPWGTTAATVCVQWLASSGRLETAQQVASQFRGVERATGSTWARNRHTEIHAKIAYYRGDLAAIDAAVPLIEHQGDQILNHTIVIWSVRAAIERGDLVEAERRLSLIPALPGCLMSANRAAAEAWLRLAQQRYAEALEIAPRAEMAAWIGWPMPDQTDDVFRWVTALARHALGDAEGARSAAADATAIASRLDENRRVGVALRIEAAVSPREEAMLLLEEAVQRLEQSAARLELAHALVALGVLLRTAGRRAVAREPLRRGLDLAARSGATVLAARAREELELAGARPRRDVLTGRDSLTRAEDRVAQLAAQELTNREIAQTLFLSVRTVETHLLRIYAKLGIKSRAELRSGQLYTEDSREAAKDT